MLLSTVDVRITPSQITYACILVLRCSRFAQQRFGNLRRVEMKSVRPTRACSKFDLILLKNALTEYHCRIIFLCKNIS